MPTILVTLTDTVTASHGIPSTFKPGPSATLLPETIPEAKTSVVFQTITSVVTSTTLVTSTATARVKPTPTPQIEFSKPARPTSGNWNDNVTINLSLTAAILLAVIALSFIGYYIWRACMGRCEGCVERNRRIAFLERGDPIKVPDPPASPAQKPQRPGSVRRPTNFPRPLSQHGSLANGDIPPVPGLPGSVGRNDGSGSSRRKNWTGDISPINIPGPQPPIEMVDHPQHVDSTSGFPTAYNSYRNPYVEDAEEMRPGQDDSDMGTLRDRYSHPERYANGVSSEQNREEPVNPYRMRGVGSPPRDPVQRAASTGRNLIPKVQKPETLQDVLDRSASIRNHRRTGGYGGFGSANP
ncbi:unnamed protein product [Periconia digitata]|uniref:Uncharacterized protein n=1 Tax=Periconia digitata TaxID=1303443 RepID=A0A9W4U1C2_9PLEO|nr:unnamed protein product [Periconia digitata]